MRKLIAAAFLLCLTFHSPSARADEPPTLPEPVRVVAAVLELSPEQVQALVTIITARDAEMRRIAQAASAQFDAVLTPEQRERLAHIRRAEEVCRVLPAFHAVGLGL